MDNMILTTLLISILSINSTFALSVPKFAPYIDVTLKDGLNWTEFVTQTRVRAFTLAFAVAGPRGECTPTWGGFALQDKDIMAHIREIKSLGLDLIVATGGASGPYLESHCKTVAELVNAYKTILDTTETTHLDIDIEAWFAFDTMNMALAQLQRERPQTTLSFTLVVAGDDYGLVTGIGPDLLQNAVQHGVRVDIVNALAMEYWSDKASWIDSIIASVDSSVNQLKQVWPQKTNQQLYNMFGVTPMIGKNFNGRIFDTSHAKQLVQWAIAKNIAFLSFWSIGRDNGHCNGEDISPVCSSISQYDFQFTQIFVDFTTNTISITTPTTPITSLTTSTTTTSTTTTSTTTTSTTTTSTTTTSTTTTPTTTSTTSTSNLITVTTSQPIVPTTPSLTDPPSITSVDCRSVETENHFYPHETDCHKYYRCYGGTPHIEICNGDTIWDDDIHACNWPEMVKRPECH